MTSSKVGAGVVKLGGLVSAGGSALGLLALFGCGSLGTRAMSGCPEGEVCSTATPDGLRFYGAGLDGTFLNGANTIAVGGTQRLRWQDASVASRSLPNHTAESDTPSVIELTSVTSGSATLTARASGSARIRVIEPSGPLLDRISVSAAPLDRVTLAPNLVTNPMREVAYLVGRREVGVALLSAEGGRLVDDSATIEADVATPASPRSWDRVAVDLPAEGATLTVSTVGRTFDVEVPVVSAVDDIAINPYFLGADNIESLEPLRVREGAVLCFDLLAGERTVVGIEETFTFVVDGEPGEGDSTLPCIGVPGVDATRTLQIELTIAGLTRTFTAEVLDAEDTSMSLVSDGPITIAQPSRGGLGERASVLRGIDIPVLVSGAIAGI